MNGRVSTGIPGLDKILNGGIPIGHTVLISGGPGTGKSLFCGEYIYSGAKEKEKGVYITLVEAEDKLREHLSSSFLWGDFDKMIDSGIFRIVKPKTYEITELIDIIEENVRDGVKRIAIDSLSVLRLGIKDEFEYRQLIQEFLTLLSGLSCTTMITYEIPYLEPNNRSFNDEEFVVDGLIYLYNILGGKNKTRKRYLEVLKLRGSGYQPGLFSYEITTKGIIVG